MGLFYEDERYFSASDVNRFDAEKFDRFIDCLAHDMDRYTADAKILENGYGKYYHNTTYVGKAAGASKEFIDRKQFDKFHVESKEVQKELFTSVPMFGICLGSRLILRPKRVSILKLWGLSSVIIGIITTNLNTKAMISNAWRGK